MATQRPTNGVAYTFYVSLVDQADVTAFKAAPTLASGDFKISKDGGAFNNLASLPTVAPAAGTAVSIVLSSGEMTCDNAVVACIDAAGDEWSDLVINIQPQDALIVATDIVSAGAITTLGGLASVDVKSINADSVTGGGATAWNRTP